jgi:hypothetical protein
VYACSMACVYVRMCGHTGLSAYTWIMVTGHCVDACACLEGGMCDCVHVYMYVRACRLYGMCVWAYVWAAMGTLACVSVCMHMNHCN